MNTIKKFILTVLIVITLSINALSVSMAAGTAVVNISGDSTAHLNSNITLTVSISDISGVPSAGLFEGRLNYDNNFLEFQSFSSLAPFNISYNNASQMMSGFSGGSEAITGSGQLFSVVFRAISIGTTTVSITDGFAGDLNAEIIDFIAPSKTINIIEYTESDNADLSSLSVVGHSISPSFAPSTTSYTLTVPNSVSSATINATASDLSATISGIGNRELSVGKNDFIVRVTAEDGTTKDYTVSITRQPTSSGDDDDNTKNGNNNGSNKDNPLANTGGNLATGGFLPTSSTQLESLFVNGKTLMPSFNPYIEDYNISVDGSVDSMDISAIPINKNAKVEIIGNTNLKNGHNVVLVKVTDENGSQRIYKINVQKENPNTILGIDSKIFWGLLALSLFGLLLFFILSRRNGLPHHIEFKPEFNFGSKNRAYDDPIYKNMFDQDNKFAFTNKNSVDDEYDIYDDNVTKDELIDAIEEAVTTRNSGKLKMLLDQESLNRQKQKLKEREN